MESQMSKSISTHSGDLHSDEAINPQSGAKLPWVKPEFTSIQALSETNFGGGPANDGGTFLDNS
jgi:hypothetical protein